MAVSTPGLAQEPAAEAPSMAPQATPKPAATPLPAQAYTLPAKEWNADDWEVVKPHLNLFEVSGYFRLRTDLIVNGTTKNNPTGLSLLKPPDDRNLIGNANMRLRISPVLNVTEDIQLSSTFDVFDNYILGSTPNAVPSLGPRVNILEVGQNARAGVNSLRDAIALRRLYAKVTTPYGELRFGRMANRWGMGMYANDGDCIDCDFGESVDRIAFVTMIGAFTLVPMVDYMSSGPSTASRFGPMGQPQDLVEDDDALQISLQFARKDSPAEIKEALSRGKVVINYGLWNMFRIQTSEAPNFFNTPSAETSEPLSDPSQNSWCIRQKLDPTKCGGKLDAREAKAYIVDAWAKLHYKKLTLEMEALFMYAQFYMEKAQGPTVTLPADKLIKARQGAIAIDARYDIFPELYVRFRAGLASGDRNQSVSLGAQGSSTYPSMYDRLNFNSSTGQGNITIDNFAFNRDYRLDLLLFRELLGTVTGAWYLKPEVTYTFANGIGGRFSPIYGQAIYSASTPGRSLPLGLEFDFEIFLMSKKLRGFEASIGYGLLVPFDGLKNGAGASMSYEPAHRLLARAAVVF